MAVRRRMRVTNGGAGPAWIGGRHVAPGDSVLVDESQVPAEFAAGAVLEGEEDISARLRQAGVTVDRETGAFSADPTMPPRSMVGYWPGVGVVATGTVQDLSGAGNHLLYTSASIDGEVQANAGFFSSVAAAQGSPKALEVPVSVFSPNPAAGDGFFLSFVLRAAAWPAGLAAVGGNAGDLNVDGLALYLNNTGNLRLYLKSGGSSPQLGAKNLALATNHRVTIAVDGQTQMLNAWVDGAPLVANYDLAGLDCHTPDSPWWFGGGGHPLRNRATQALRFADVTLVARNGAPPVHSPVFCDWLLRARPGYILTAQDVQR